MKRDLGWLSGPALALAAVVGVSSMQPHAATSGTENQFAAEASHGAGSGADNTDKPRSAAAADQDLPPGPCHDMAGLLRDFFTLGDRARFGPDACGRDEKGAALSARPNKNVRFVIASLPDPIHTHLPLVFDRNVDAIEQAAQDAGYTYDSSWLPWEQSEAAPALLADKDALEKRRELKEDQPGLLLFRKTLDSTGSPNPFQDALVVFVVGDEATSGISLTQFHNAVEWIAQMQPLQGPVKPPVQILGPSFSGSMPSLTKALAQKLDSGGSPESILVPGNDQHLDIYSGQLKNREAALWFQEQARRQPLDSLRIRFHSFQADSDTMETRYIRYLDSIGIGGCHLAIVTEDETAFGSAYKDPSRVQPASPPDPSDKPAKHESFCDYAAAAPATDANSTKRDRFKPTIVYYPRDISALRAAYQEQSLFSRGPAQSGADSARHTLRSDFSDPDATAINDSVHRYGGNQTALSEEAVLLQIVSILRFHETQFILLRASNTLDQLFLSEFFKRLYPEGRVVILDSDLLLRRDAGSNGMNGVTVLGTYPLLPGSDHWTNKLIAHQHRAIPQSNVMGTYVALRFLLRSPPILPPQGKTPTAGEQALTECLQAQDTEIFLPPTCGEVEIPNYAPPLWVQSDKVLRKAPVIWLAVLGNDGFWPVAALDGHPLSSPHHDDALNTIPTRLLDLLRRAVRWPSVIGSSLGGIADTLLHGDREDSLWRPMPLSMKIALAVLLCVCLFNLHGYGHGSATLKPNHRAYFVRSRNNLVMDRISDDSSEAIAAPLRSHIALLVGAAALISNIGTMLGWSYGWMSPYGETVLYSRLYAAIPIVIWCLGAVAVAINVWTETRFSTSPEPENRYLRDMFAPGTFRLVSRNLIGPLLGYTGLTAGFYVFYLINLDSTLPSQVRTLTYLRAMNLTTGVSPVVPLVILAAGMYGWLWYALRGLALFGADRPILPTLRYLRFSQNLGGVRSLKSQRSSKAQGAPKAEEEQNPFRPLSAEVAGKNIDSFCFPFHTGTWIAAGLCLALILLASQLISPGVPLRSLGSRRYAFVVSMWLAVIISVLLANAWQLSQLWLQVRALLEFLDKLPLRRTMQALRGFSWGSIWNMSGNVLDVRYRIFYRQTEAISHFLALCRENPARFADAGHWEPILKAHMDRRRQFSIWYSHYGQVWWRRDFSVLQGMQYQSARIGGKLFSELIVPAWRREHESLLLLPPDSSDVTDAEAEHMRQSVADLPAEVRAAEEIFCLLYLGFIQNVLGRMRSLVVGMSCLFLSIALMIPSYPFDPRPLLAGSVILLFLIVGGVVFFVYQGLFRDATLSRITNTKPGELGSEFWLKFVSFGIGPIFGVLATIFPQVSDFFFSWLEPSLSSLK